MADCSGRPPRIAVIGCSWFTKAAHLPALRQLAAEGLVEVVALCSRTEASLAAAQQVLGFAVPTYTDMDALLRNEQVDAVDIILPTTMIASAIQKSLLAGKHVISEKPCAMTVAQSSELLAFHHATEGELTWSVAENWPFKPTVVTLQNILKMGMLGGIEAIDFAYKSVAWSGIGQGWRANADFKGGYILDSGVHFISMLRALGGGIAEVSADVGWHPSAHVADRVSAQVTYENQAQGRFLVDFKNGPGPEDLYHLHVKCRNGNLKANFLTGRVLLQIGDHAQIMEIPNDAWVTGGVYPMLRHFCESLTKKTVPACTPMEGLRDVAAIEAMLESSRLGRPVAPAALHRQLNGCGQQIQTFGSLFGFKPRHVVHPKSVAEVKTAVREAAAAGLPVRTLGAGNNWTGYARTGGVSINLSGLNGIIGIDAQRKTVRAWAGTRLGDVTKALAGHGLCLPSLPFLTTGTVGGMVATASHGTSPHWGTVSDAVLSLSLISAAGEAVHIHEGSAPELLKAARVSVGMLGVITEVELQAVDMKWTRNIQLDLALDEFTQLRPAVFQRYEHVWAHWLLGNERLIIQCLETRSAPEQDFAPYVKAEGGNWVQQYYHAAPMQVGRDPMMLSMQYGVPLHRLPEAIRQVNASAFAATYAGREIELKFLKHDPGSFLGPNAEDDMVLFNIFWPAERGAAHQVLSEFESIMHGLHAKPHWGKFHAPPEPGYLAKSYPNWQAFDAVRREMDPRGMFACL